jgi:AbrB family looped-hinge helix DNA binding protein
MVASRKGEIAMSVVTLNSKYQLVVPKELRDRKKWRPGQEFAFIDHLDGVKLVPVPKREELGGLRKARTSGNIVIATTAIDAGRRHVGLDRVAVGHGSR